MFDDTAPSSEPGIPSAGTGARADGLAGFRAWLERRSTRADEWAGRARVGTDEYARAATEADVLVDVAEQFAAHLAWPERLGGVGVDTGGDLAGSLARIQGALVREKADITSAFARIALDRVLDVVDQEARRARVAPTVAALAAGSVDTDDTGEG